MARSPSGLIFLLLLGMVALIAYGSLYPFNFQPEASAGGILEVVRQLSWARAGRSDRIANVLLYVPLGFCLLLWLGMRLGRNTAAVLAVVLGSLLSLAIEIAQGYLSSRVPSLTDLTLNACGTALGVGAAFAWRGMGRLMRFPLHAGGQSQDPCAALVLALWLAWRLAPFVPQIDLGKLKAALRPLFDPHFEAGAVLSFLTFWLVVSEALAALVSRARHLEALLLTIAGVLVGRLVVANQAFVPAELLALLLLLPALVLMNRLTTTPRRLLLIGAITAFVIVDRLAPFEFAAAPARFDFWPFMAWLEPGLPAALAAVDWPELFGKLFVFSAFLWVIRAGGVPLSSAAVFMVAMVLVTEIMQLWLPQRGGSITDPTLAVIAALAFRSLDGSRQRALGGRITVQRGRSL